GEPPTIKDIEECLWRAAMLAPDSPQPNVELGHHYYAVEDDAAEGLEHFREAESRARKWLLEAYLGIEACAEELGDEKTLKEIKAKLNATFPHLAEFGQAD
ncbi:MAG: hypothetical protein AAGC55_23775, partial [Myxococcota bacterium]